MDRDVIRIDRVCCSKPVNTEILGNPIDMSMTSIIPFSPEERIRAASITFPDGQISELTYYDQIMPDKQALDFSSFALSNTSLLVFTNIRCDRIEQAILRVGHVGCMKIWLNGEPFLNNRIGINDSYYIRTKLNKGNNIVVVQISDFTNLYYAKAYKPLPASFSIRVARESYEYAPHIWKYVGDHYQSEMINKICVVKDQWDFSCEEEITFSLLPKDFIGVDITQGATLKFFNEDNSCQSEMTCEFNKTIRLPRSLFHNAIIVEIYIHYATEEGKRIHKDAILLGDMNVLVKRIKLLSEQKSKNPLFSQYCRQIHGRVEQFQAFLDGIGKYKQIEMISAVHFLEYYRDIYEMFVSLDTNKTLIEHMTEKKFFTYFFESRLDQTNELINLYLPQDYDSHVGVPLVLFTSTGRYSWNAKYFYSIDFQSNAIIADVTCRGYTMGSYSGQASFFDCVQELQDLFTIDQDLIYAAGYRTGASAVWTIAELNPCFFTAIAAISGEFNFQLVENMMNNNILTIVGDQDDVDVNALKAAKAKLDVYQTNYELVVMEESDGDTTHTVFYSAYLVEWLLQQRKKQHMTTVFVADRLSHNKADGLEILELQKPGVYGRIITKRFFDKITINTENIQSFRLYVDKRTDLCTLSVNGVDKNIQKEDIYESALEVEIHNGDFHIINKFCVPQDILRMPYSVGIADIFYHSLNLVISDISDNNTIQALHKAAQVYSEPYVNSPDPNIYVQYPIIKSSSLTLEQLKERSYIFFFCCASDPLMDFLLEHLPIKVTKQGFSYQDQWYKGSYIIMQCIKNPWNNMEKLVVIDTNNVLLYKKFFFTKRLILTSNLTGYNVFLNSVAIILYEQTYYIVKKWGNALDDIRDG